MSIEMQDLKTPLEPKQVFFGLYNAWLQLFGDTPKKESLLVLLAQSTLESGAGYKSCHLNNIGNFKHIDGDGRDFTYFKCSEIINGKEIWFSPPDPACCFRAYKSLQDGCIDYLSSLHKRFNKSWQAVLDGNPTEFVISLKKQRYFTANLDLYIKGVVSLFNQYSKDPNLSTDNLPILSDEQKTQLLNLVALTAQETINDVIEDTGCAVNDDKNNDI